MSATQAKRPRTLADTRFPEEWVSHRVKVDAKDSPAQHPCRALLVGIHGKKALVKPPGHRKVEAVPMGRVILWWAFAPASEAARYDTTTTDK